LFGAAVGSLATIALVIRAEMAKHEAPSRPHYSAIGAARARTTGREDLFEAIERRLQ
jgi:hypothetical protein